MNIPSVSLLIPCYNEESRIDRMFQGIGDFAREWKADFEVIITDDGSTDRTAPRIRSHPGFQRLQKEGKISYIYQENTGKGGALKRGAASSSKEFILTLDADMATSPLQLISWLKDRQEFHNREILIGSRELDQSVIKEVTVRKFVGNVFNFIIRTLVGIQIRDTQCGFKLYPGEIGRSLFAGLQTPGWAHDVELLIRGKQMGCEIIEMPVTWTAIEGSKISVVRDSWKMFLDVVAIRRMTRKK